ncbi:amidase domain-containing protein [Clostridium estertheticum]|uniref:amidase domain-containing protein n=1 Tax=Clostridium estertheticum TaxID=238834 RepID=UPI001CF14EAA|nr:amidase domain-containing protein [Clostridium estertheticum]MCB2306864.1 amidase domain-containing protein [Clostridium estertheticum]MCB2345347.1 amidase domain-containing protein [Clostridium estertheticum]MCB2350370.1 amidase domain-containing protein [Clostridium estertheticum]WAG45232.1 amidase domain-containing protein [Clostridium estertheticum]
MPSKYDRELATSYAMQYALEPNKRYKFYEFVNGNGGDCTNFVSQCLMAGGATMDYNNVRPWWYNGRGKSSICWAVANSLFWYLKTNQKLNRNVIKGLEVEDLSKLEIGDVVFYENYSNSIFHAAIITSFIDGSGIHEPRISQHSYNQINETYVKNYDYKKAHFLKITL